jgi:hypothetical protein
MIEADSVHSTPRIDSSSLRAFDDLEEKVCDSDHLAEIALDLSHDVINRSDAREAELAFLMMQIVRKECQQLKADYCAAYEDGE